MFHSLRVTGLYGEKGVLFLACPVDCKAKIFYLFFPSTACYATVR